MENITIIFDIAIAIISVLVLIKLTGYGGIIGQTLQKIGYGIVIIGVSQLVETIGLYILGNKMSEVDILHFFHRLILLIGVLLVYSGFKKLMTKG
ncbi:MAG: hypothetical protein WAV25_02540 [Minisyncoccia bacterium]